MAAWSDWTGWGDDNDEDDDQQGSSGAYSSTRDCLILLIDANLSMFIKAEDTKDVPFELCIKCAKSVLLNKIVSSEKDLVGIVFFGTNIHKNPSEFKHVYTLQDLDMPDASRIKQLEEILEDENFTEFQKEYGSSSDFSLSDVFWTCQMMFSTSGTKLSHRRILLFTNNDNPHKSDIALQRQAKTKAKDLAENGIDVELMHLGNQFDVSQFYRDIIFNDEDDATILPDPSERFEELLTRVRSKEFKKRTMQKINFSLGPGLDMGVGVYCMVRETKKPSFIRLDQRTNEELKTRTKMLCEDTGTVLLPTDIKYYQEFGGERVIFEKEEVNEMKKLGTPGLTLLGFKPKTKLKLHHYIKPANFIYPDESLINGSTKLFTALLQKCLEREVIAICKFIPRANSSPVFIALLPQEEELDDNVQLSPPGFHVIFLPFTEDVRKLNLPESRKVTTEQIDKAKEIVKKLKFDFQSEAFENPVLQKHYRTLEALALEHEQVEDVEDLTMPDEQRINKRVGQSIEAFKEAVYPAGYVPGVKTTKRKATASSDTSTAKRGRTASASNVDVDVETVAKNGTLNKLTVVQLKGYLTSVGVKASGKKQDLINTINEHLGL